MLNRSEIGLILICILLTPWSAAAAGPAATPLMTSIQKHAARSNHAVTVRPTKRSRLQSWSCPRKVGLGLALGAGFGAAYGSIKTGTTGGDAGAGAVYGAILFGAFGAVVGLGSCR
jgi:hypothetical protein